MKMITKRDLQLVIACLRDVSCFDADDFTEILDRFGSDYFVGDGRQLEETAESEEMREVRHAMPAYLREVAPTSVTCTRVFICPVCHYDRLVHKGRRPYYCEHCGAPIIKASKEERN